MVAQHTGSLSKRANTVSAMRWRIRALDGLILVLAGALTGGCVTPRVLNMTYHSDPEGATLYEGGRLWGYTPLTLTYPGGRAAFARNECLSLNPMQVRWASGVTASITNLQACPATGLLQQYVFVRPASAPGADIDANFAIQLQRNGVMQQQADGQDATAVAEFLRSQNAATRSRAGQ